MYFLKAISKVVGLEINNTGKIAFLANSSHYLPIMRVKNRLIVYRCSCSFRLRDVHHFLKQNTKVYSCGFLLKHKS